jgi:hypothetical protein
MRNKFSGGGGRMKPSHAQELFGDTKNATVTLRKTHPHSIWNLQICGPADVFSATVAEVQRIDGGLRSAAPPLPSSVWARPVGDCRRQCPAKIRKSVILNHRSAMTAAVDRSKWESAETPPALWSGLTTSNMMILNSFQPRHQADSLTPLDKT